MSQEFQAGQTIGHGRFVLERELGRGGMGVVWLALDEHLAERVALKFLPPQLASDPEAVDSLRREVSKSRKLSHPNIVRIHDLILSQDEPPFVSMEYIEGSNLSELKITQPQQLFAWESIEPVVRQLCSALDYAHQEKVVHRDLKPGNMMLDGEARLKLADFGLAATMSESMSRMTADLGSSGTPAYMSPQQFDGRVPKASDDIYALGATIYELLTSKPPFFAGDIMHQVRSIPPQPMEERLADLELVNDIPPAVAAMVMACLSKEREQRPESARVVAEWIGLDMGDFAGATSASLSTPGLASSAVEWEEPVADVAVEPSAPRSKGKALVILPALAMVCLAAVFFMMKGNGGKPGGAGAGVWENSLGMKFVPVEGTEVLFSVWETRVQDYAAYAAANPGVDMSWKNLIYEAEPISPGATHPVVYVSWDDAQAFCRWLTQKERREGSLQQGASYRLPTDLEWSAAVGLPQESGATPEDRAGKILDVYPWGKKWPPPAGVGNYSGQESARARRIDGYRDDYPTTAPVGSFRTNSVGLYDLGGNVCEWCEDWNSNSRRERVLRGGSWFGDDPGRLLSSSRISHAPDFRNGSNGFRVVLAGVLSR